MFEFFIALFGGLYYGGRFLSEKINKNLAEAKQKKWDTVWRLLHDYSVEHDVSELMKTQEGRNSILSSIKDDVIYVFGEHYKDIFEDYLYNEQTGVHRCDLYGFGDVWNIAYVIYLSKLGYVNSIEYAYTRAINGVKKSNAPGKYYEYVQENQDWSLGVCLRTCDVIEKNIQYKHGELCRLVNSDCPAYIKVTKRWKFE